MNMRKQQINVLSSIPADQVRSIKDFPLEYNQLSDIPTNLMNEIESNS